MNKKTVKVNDPILTQNYTYIEHERDYKFNAPHHFEVKRVEDSNSLCRIDFQEGPIKENGVNGVANEDLLGMVLTRLKKFQESDYACQENADAIMCIENALGHLRARTNKRINKGIEGTSKI
jgi:uncharacterized protein YqfB (UPF0267 family)